MKGVRAAKNISVFLVDDDPLFLHALERYLLNRNKNVLKIKTFSTGEACLEKINENPDIIILDYYLNSSLKSAMNGMAVLKRIGHSNSSLKVVMLSGQDKLEIAMDTIEQGAYDYVCKSESAFVRINNIVLNISDNISLKSRLDLKIAFYKRINIIFIIVVILLFLLSRLIS